MDRSIWLCFPILIATFGTREDLYKMVGWDGAPGITSQHTTTPAAACCSDLWHRMPSHITHCMPAQRRDQRHDLYHHNVAPAACSATNAWRRILWTPAKRSTRRRVTPVTYLVYSRVRRSRQRYNITYRLRCSLAGSASSRAFAPLHPTRTPPPTTYFLPSLWGSMISSVEHRDIAAARCKTYAHLRRTHATTRFT